MERFSELQTSEGAGGEDCRGIIIIIASKSLGSTG
jgi:hypothetical protein